MSGMIYVESDVPAGIRWSSGAGRGGRRRLRRGGGAIARCSAFAPRKNRTRGVAATGVPAL